MDDLLIHNLTNLPIIDCIDFNKAVVDTMHMGLRIMEKLFDKLVNHLSIFDGKESNDLTKSKYFKRLN